jgi:hypothetical protein
MKKDKEEKDEENLETPPTIYFLGFLMGPGPRSQKESIDLTPVFRRWELPAFPSQQLQFAIFVFETLAWRT